MTDTGPASDTAAPPAARTADPEVVITKAWTDLLAKVAAGHISCQERPGRRWLHSPTAALHYRVPKTIPDKLLAAGLIELSGPQGPLEARHASLTDKGAAVLAPTR